MIVSSARERQRWRLTPVRARAWHRSGAVMARTAKRGPNASRKNPRGYRRSRRTHPSPSCRQALRDTEASSSRRGFYFLAYELRTGETPPRFFSAGWRIRMTEEARQDDRAFYSTYQIRRCFFLVL